MKCSRYFLIPVSLILLSILVACNISSGEPSESPSDTENQPAQSIEETSAPVDDTTEAATETATEAATEEDTTPVVLFENEDYIIMQIQDNCYINFSAGNGLADHEHNPGVGYLEFTSVTHMKDSFLNGSAASDGWMSKVLRSAFYHNADENGTRICNLTSLYEPVYPDNFQISKVSLNSNANYHFSISHFPDSNAEKFMAADTNVVNEGSYNHYYNSKFLAFEDSSATVTNRTSGSYDNVHCEIVEYEKSNDTQYKDHLFDIDKDGITYHINISYMLKTPDIGGNDNWRASEELPYSAYMFWQQDGQHFYVEIVKLNIVPTVEWLTSFGVTPYVDNADQSAS